MQWDLSEENLHIPLILRNTPEIHFVLDQSIEYGVTMSKKIDDVVKDIENDEDDTENEE